MVKAIFILLLLSLGSIQALEETVVNAEIEGKVREGMPVKGTLTLTHDRNDKVDENSFKIENKPLKVEFLKDVKISESSPLVISFYQFTLEPQPAGLQALPEISVQIGKNTYKTIPSTYQVEKSVPMKDIKGEGLLLGLETLLEGEKALYPGQRMTVGYRFTYRYNVDLTVEDLPLLEAKGFRKIGSKESAPSVKKDINFLDVTQVIEAASPGEFEFARGKIAGKAYKTDMFGQKNYFRSELTAETPAVSITVLSFPERGKPPSFNGAIGESLTMETKLLTSKQIAVGDKIVLEITIKGVGELATLPMPEVCCQPGFSGFFKLSDLPPNEELFGSSKTFKVEMRPLSGGIKEIPTLELSYFNPEKKSYEVRKTPPIPLKITADKPVIIPQATSQPAAKVVPAQEQTPPAPQSIEIEGNFSLADEDLENKPFGTWHVLWVIPFALAGLFLQTQLKSYLEKKQNEPVIKDSQILFKEAMEQKTASPLYFQLLHQAFMLRLFERGEIPDPESTLEHLSEIGAVGDVRAFLKEIENKRFSGKTEQFGPEFNARAAKLFKELKK